MARKKAGSRAAAGQAKARERARRKARVAGPSLAQAAYVPPSDDAPEAEPESAATTMEAAQTAPSPAPAPEAPAPVAAPQARTAVQASPRRERQLTGMTPTGSLKRELALIGSITLIIAAALAALSVTNTLGA